MTTDRPYEGIPLCDFERIRYELRPCDILLIEGRSRVSDIIRGITQSSWSHAALYIGRLHDIEDPKVRNLLSIHFKGSADSQLLIEGIMGQGTIVSNLSTYKNDHIRICRPRGISRHDAQNVISFAIHRLGEEYDTRQIFDLARFLLPWTIMPRRLRSKLFEFNVGETTKTVCSSMLAEAFLNVEFPILPLIKKHGEQGIELIARNPKLYTPRDFDYSPYFDIIKYPFVEFADYAMYRKLPWNREGLMSHDGIGVRSLGPTLGEEKPVKKKEDPIESD
ncbi:MAG TPA: YiiX/YebB-like N1pC/P60 family cysteine hydrolase [Gammaproteobacteria bacterium]|nr:YiiX/YebB-like N1pC/P60 family cysteine hydrolase [Gammaproteobacteria bacterium]